LIQKHKKIKKSIFIIIKMAKSRSPKHSAKKSPKRSLKRSRSCTSAEKQGYCVVCHKKVNMVGAKLAKTKNGRDMMKGKCPKCGTGVNRFLSKQ
jgi:hypothetical protein